MKKQFANFFKKQFFNTQRNSVKVSNEFCDQRNHAKLTEID